MDTIFYIIGAIVLAIVVFVIYRVQKVKKQQRELEKQRFERIQPLAEKLESGEPITSADVLPYAQNLSTRALTYELLANHGKAEHFPEQYNTLLKASESLLANWLEWPTELDACPDEVEHIKRVSIDYDGQNNFVHYEVFKYRINEPHWAAENGWILGIVGPYFDDSKPYDHAQFTFSRVSSTLDTVSPEDEAKWVHENLQKVR